jgi:hypothetical protein
LLRHHPILRPVDFVIGGIEIVVLLFNVYASPAPTPQCAELIVCTATSPSRSHAAFGRRASRSIGRCVVQSSHPFAAALKQ